MASHNKFSARVAAAMAGYSIITDDEGHFAIIDPKINGVIAGYSGKFTFDADDVVEWCSDQPVVMSRERTERLIEDYENSAGAEIDASADLRVVTLTLGLMGQCTGLTMLFVVDRYPVPAGAPDEVNRPMYGRLSR